MAKPKYKTDGLAIAKFRAVKKTKSPPVRKRIPAKKPSRGQGKP